MTTGSTASNRMALPIHHKTMALSSARCLIGAEETAAPPPRRRPRGPQAREDGARRAGGGRAGDPLTAPGAVDPVGEVDREIPHEHGAAVGDHAPPVLCRGAGELQVLGDADLGAAA